MKLLRALSIGVPTIAAGVAIAFASYRRAMARTKRAWQEVTARKGPGDNGIFDPSMVAGLPEIGQRYFSHAIAPGTPIRTAVQIEMRGAFLLGDKSEHQTYAMEARQILRPPSEFVWIAKLGAGWMHISGSDALVDGTAWTRFWLMGLVPIANAQSSADLVRSAAFRSAMEPIWAPASLLPARGVEWEQIGPDTARLRVRSAHAPIMLEMSLPPNGAVKEIVGQRWSDANLDKKFRFQPFGGTTVREGTFAGYTIPTSLMVGNHYGTEDYLPFFQAEIVATQYLD